MNILLSLLLVFIFLNSVLKLSFWKWGAVAIFTIGVGAFLWNVLDFAFPGASFTHLAGWYGMGVIGIILLGSRALKSLLPERELRLEVHLLMNVFVTLLGLTCTASGQIIYVPHSEPLNWLLLGEIFLFFSGLFVLGFFLKKYFHF